MKRFVLTLITFGVLAFLTFFMTTRYGFYLDFDNEESIETPFVSEGKKIYRVSNGQREELLIKGVGMTSSFNIHGRSEYAMNKEDYERWFMMIGEMGANTIKVYDVMDDDFYEALYSYNTSSDQPLYLLQTINVEDMINEGPYSANEDCFKKGLIDNGKKTVDIIHGRRIIDFNEKTAYGNYLYDVSEWTIGYLVGYQFNQDMIVYTDKSEFYDKGYSGKFFYTEGSNFESVIAEIMDEITFYEYDKYNSLRIIGVSNDPSYDMINYEDELVDGNSYRRMLNKYATFDPENIKKTELLSSGYFVSYNLYDFVEDFYLYMDSNDVNRYKSILDEIDSEEIYDGYIDFINRYHTMPLIIGDYGFSDARTYTRDDDVGSVKDQGKLLVNVFETAKKDGLSGAVVSTFNDQWDNRTWNVSYRYDNNNLKWFNDVLSENESFGIMKYVSDTVIIDGMKNEWNEKYLVNQDEFGIYTRFDEIGLNLMIDGYQGGDTLYIPIDITDKSGSSYCRELDLRFKNDADFVIVISDDEAYLLVQEYYDANRVNYLKEINGEDPFIDKPLKDSSSFKRSLMVARNDDMDIYKKDNYLRTYDVGIFKKGTDFVIDEVLEIRIPYGLLNFYDPSKGLIHDDYYENYGVKPLKINDIYIGASVIKNDIEMYGFEYDFDLDSREYHESLKDAYYQLKDCWKE